MDLVPETMDDERLIASVSAGLALYGVIVGQNGHTFENARKQVLRMPANCKLRKTRQQYIFRSGIVGDLNVSEEFLETVRMSGWSIALKIAAHGDLSFLGGEVGANGELEKQTMTTGQTHQYKKELWKLECYYVPRESFQIHHSQMHLSDEALIDVRRLQTLGDAKVFIRNYGSHIPDREYQVGGLLLRGAGVKSNGKTEYTTLLETADRQLPTMLAGISIPWMEGFKVGASFKKSKSKTTWQKDESSNLDVSAYAGALGPPTADEKKFVKQIKEDKSTWFIIDISEDVSLVPIWEVVEKEAEGGDLKRQMKLLETAWQISRLHDGFRDHTSSPKLVEEISRREDSMRRIWFLEQMQCWILAELYGLETSVPEVRLLQPRDIVGILSRIHGFATSNDIFKNVPYNVTALLFEVPAFMELATYIAESSEMQHMNAARQVLNTILNKELEQHLREEGCVLSMPLQEMLELRRRDDGLAPLEIEVPPLGLPNFLRSVIEMFHSVEEDSNHHAPFTEYVAKIIKACIQKYKCEKVKKVVKNYWFDEHGSYTSHLFMTKKQVKDMIEDLSDSLQQQYELSAPLPSGVNHSVAPYVWSSTNCYSYNEDIIIDRTLERNDVHERMIDCIRHRVDPFSLPNIEMESTFDFSWDQEDVEFGADCEDDNGFDTSQSQVSSTTSSPLLLLIQIMRRSDLTFQMTLNKLLLEQRISIPLIFRKNGPTSRLAHILESIRFVEVKTTNQKLVSIYDDNELPRVIFASQRKDVRIRECATMASEVLGCHFVSQHSDGELESGPVLELGIGFYDDISQKQDSSQKAKQLPCLAFCIWGAIHEMRDVVKQLGDIIIMECESGSQKVPLEELESIKHLYWETNSSRNAISGSKKKPFVSGSFKHVVSGIGQYLKAQCALVKKENVNGSFELEKCLEGIEPLQCVNRLTDIVGSFPSSITMKSELLLQKSYAREAKFQFEASRIRNNPPEYRAKEREAQKEVKKRQHMCARIANLQILKLFMEKLGYQDPVYRRLSIIQIQRYFNQQNRLSIEAVVGKVDKAFEAFQSAPSHSVGYQMLHDAKAQNVERMLGLEHLWRELCHVFIADPRKGDIPTLAAHHLLDGFPLEILDGEAGMYCKRWVDRVLLTLNNILIQHLGREPRVFVMSVVGLQSSGKSTLLNTMFGTQLQTSAGRCTRGVYLQLVKSNRKEYDYVLLLDTEGIRAPEFFGLEGSEVHDNRLATFAVLPADACVVVVSNEDDSGLKEVLSMVMLAYKGSAMTMNSGGWMPSKLFFVYRSIDTNDQGQLRSNQLKLREHLQQAAFEAARPIQQVTADDLIKSVINFRVHQDEDKSDVKYLGNLKKENMPPGDTPDWAYGTKVMEIREYIHKRVTEEGVWRSHTLTEWGDYLGMVWKCIATADFELSFRSLVEFTAYEELTNTMENYRRVVTKKYDEEFEIFERSLHNQTGILEDTKVLTSIMLDNVEETITEQSAKVGVLLNNPRWQKWKIQEREHWKEYIHLSRFHWKGRCQSSAGVLKFETIVRRYYQKLQLKIKDLFKDKEIVMNKEQPELFESQVDLHFENLFQRILQEVGEKHKPSADQVPRWLESVYIRSNISQVYDLHTHDRSFHQFELGYPSTSSTCSSISKRLDAKGIPRFDEGLKKMVDKCLADAIKYSDHLVENVITKTETFLKECAQQHRECQARSYQQNAHIWVKRYLNDQLCVIQQRWDVEHNVAKKLEQEKERLRNFFVDCANEVGGSEMLAQAILDVLHTGRQSKEGKNNMIEAFLPKFIKDFTKSLEGKQWLSNPQVIRAILDLHLLNIAETGSSKEEELLHWTTHGSEHYEFIMENLLTRFLINYWRDHKPWNSFLAIMKIILNRAAVAGASTCGHSGVTQSRKGRLDRSGLEVFLKTLSDGFNSTISQSLASSINSIGVDVYEYSNLDYSVIENTIVQTVDTPAFAPDLNDIVLKKKVIKLVRNRLMVINKSGAEPRCEETCPKCGLTCFKKIKHNGLHDTLHQPKGLVGIRLSSKSNREFNNQLSCTSCSRAVIMNAKWKKSKDQRGYWFNKCAKYKDFTKYYPTWEVPSDTLGRCASVREYIFFNYQEAIVRRFPGSKQCTSMPPEYDHDPQELRIELENILKKHFKFQDSRTFLLRP